MEDEKLRSNMEEIVEDGLIESKERKKGKSYERSEKGGELKIDLGF